MALKRELGLLDAVFYGIGMILGAGIYVLIALGAGLAGDMLWLPFLVSAVIALFTALSYAELSSMFQKDAAEYNYARKAFKAEALPFAIGWVLAVGMVIATATVAIGFGGYLYSLTGVQPQIGALCIILLMSLLNYYGIQRSSEFNIVATSIEILGLLLVIIVAFMLPAHPGVDFLKVPPGGFGGIIAAVSIIFFAFIGFENLANLSEEVKDSKRVIPTALILSLAISALLYVLVAFAAIHAVGWEALSRSEAPLTLVVTRGLGPYASVLSYIALFATANATLMFMIAASRILYGMSEGGSLLKIFSRTGSRGTPYISVAVVGIAAAFIAYAFDMQTVAQLANLAVFIAYVFVNASLIALAGTKDKRGFRSPRIFGIPIIAWFGLISALFLLANFPPVLWLIEAAVVLAGLALFLLNRP